MSEEPRAPEEDEDLDRVRRRLLKLGIYVAPAIMSFGVFTQSAYGATGCAPCGPNCTPLSGCGPGCGPSGNCTPNGNCGPSAGGRRR